MGENRSGDPRPDVTPDTGNKGKVVGSGGSGVVVLAAPAKLTVSLRVLDRRPDGYHNLDAEMVALDLCDVLEVDPSGDGLRVETAADGAIPSRVADLPRGSSNLVSRALSAVRRTAGVLLTKRIPVGGGLGGGSADAAAILRWAGCLDPQVASGLGADVPFCVVGGRAHVTGVGEVVRPLPYEERTFVLLIPPFGVDTAAVYRAWDRLGPDAPGEAPGSSNDLTAAAISVEPRLEAWRRLLEELTGARAALAGSGATWYVEGSPSELGVEGISTVTLGGAHGSLVAVRTVPQWWEPEAAGTRLLRSRTAPGAAFDAG